MEVEIDMMEMMEDQVGPRRSGVNDENSTNSCRFQSQSGRGGMMKTLLIDVDPQGSGGSDTAGTPQQETDYYLS